ncbi:hypothetical protein [Caballeronia grimmiae]|uniref:hypothetical protein n=1 Tax=Caballeronia grimmiae TaxID=1071679 RepID=UPI0038BB58AF
MTLQLVRSNPPPPVIRSMSTPDEPADADSDDLDDVLDETGAVTNRSDGKTGTDTEAEPNRKS